MFQIKDNKVYQLIRFTPSTAMTLGIYSSKASAEQSRDRRKLSATSNEDCYFVIKEWQLDDVIVPENTNTSFVRVTQESSGDLITSTPARYSCSVNNKEILEEGTSEKEVFEDRVDAVCRGLLDLVPENSSYIEAKLLLWETSGHSLGDLSFIRENLTDFAGSQNITIVIE